jgi:agmatinase
MKYFLDIEQQYRDPQQSRYTVLLVPNDGTSTWRKGADRGPEAVVEASCYVELYDLETQTQAYTQGICTQRPRFDFRSPEGMVHEVAEQVHAVMERGSMPVLIGGEHSISIGAVKAMAAGVPNVSVLQLDAHADLRNEYRGSAFNHACAMARIREVCPIVQVGIRSMDGSEKAAIESDRFFPAYRIHDTMEWMEKAAGQLSQNVYLTIDLDVFDPAIMPDTGTPEPGGLTWYPVLDFLRRVVAEKNIVGFDVVELCPGDNPHPAFLAAKLIYKIITYHTLTGNRAR